MKTKSLPRLMHNPDVIILQSPSSRLPANKGRNVLSARPPRGWGWFRLLLLFWCLLDAPPAPGAVVASLTTQFNLDYANGNKVVVGKNNYLHCVYQSAGKIWYTWSTDGSTWIAPVVISGSLANCATPTIGVDSKGTLGVAFYALGTKIYYVYKPYNSANSLSWSPTPAYIIQDVTDSQTAIVGYRDEMHLVWISLSPKYTHFKSVSPPATPIISVAPPAEDVAFYPVCGTTAYASPSIAIARAPADVCDQTNPIIRVAYLYTFDGRTTCADKNYLVGLGVAQRPRPGDSGYSSANNAPWTSVPASYTDLFQSTSPSALFTFESTSLTANRLSSDFFLAYSMKWNPGNGPVQFISKVAIIPPVVDAGHPVLIAPLPGVATADLDASVSTTGAGRLFRVVYKPTAGTAYSAMNLTEVNWNSAIPTFSTASQLTAAGRSGQALNFRRHLSGANYVGIRAIYDHKTTSGSEIASDYAPVPTPGYSPLIPGCLDLSAGVFGPATVILNGAFSSSFVVTNTSISNRSGIIVSYPMPAGVTFLSASQSQGIYTNEMGTLVWDLGQLDPGAGATIDLSLLPTEPGTLTNTILVTSDQTDLETPVVAQGVTQVVDLDRPTVVSAVAPCNQAKLTVRFSEPMDPASASEPANYFVDSGAVNITSVFLASDGRSVKLTLDGPITSPDYLDVGNVTDLGGNIITPDPMIFPINVCCPSNACLVLICPSNVVVECADPLGTLVQFNVTANDSCDTNVTLTCIPPSGSLFPFGTTTVHCSGYDDCGKTNSCSFMVMVVDTTGPAVLCPNNVLVSSSNQPVVYSVSAVDNHDTNVIAVCSPPSGSIFPLGDTTVVCTATDQSGNSGTNSFVVTVMNPPVIMQQPISLTITQGTTVTFSATALGTEPLTYQWACNNTNISGATNSVYTVVSAQPLNAGNYNVRVSNLIGALTSSNALLTVLSTPPTNYDVSLPVYVVTQAGATGTQVTSLANYLNLPAGLLTQSNGLVSFLDPTNYLAVPTFRVTNPSIVSNLLAQTTNQYPAIPLVCDSLDFTALSNLTVLADNAALSSTANALGFSGLSPQFGSPVIQHAHFIAFYTNDNNIVVSNNTPLDTMVNYRFYDPNGYPFVGPGAQVQVSYGAAGNVTRLLYAARQMTAGPSVQVLSASQASNRVAGLFPRNAQIDLQLVYYCPPFSSTPQCAFCPPPVWNPTHIIPYYLCRGIVNVTNPVSGEVSALNLLTQMIPATDDTNFVSSVGLSVSAPGGGTQVVANVSVTGGTPPYSYLWGGSDPDASTNTGSSLTYTPIVRVATPPLAIVVNGGSVTVTWPYPSTGFILESAASLGDATWSQITNSIQSSSNLNSVTLSTTNARFFRSRLASQTVAVNETVMVTVTDANGVSVRSGHSFEAQAAPNRGPYQLFVPPDYGCESPFDPGVGYADRAGWFTGMSGGGAGYGRFCRTGTASWPGDFIEPVTPGVLPANPQVYGCADYLDWGVNSANIVLYIGHGATVAISFTYPTPCPTTSLTDFASLLWEPPVQKVTIDNYTSFNPCIQASANFVVPNFTGSWRNSGPTVNDRLYWLCLLSCNVLQQDGGSYGAVWGRWGPAFNGLHVMTGFASLAWAGTGFSDNFAYRILGRAQNKPTIAPQTIVQSWMDAAAATQTGNAAAMGPIQNIVTPGPFGGYLLYQITDFNDYYWGKGPVGPSIPPNKISGWWYVYLY